MATTSPETQPTKSIFASKTIWINSLIALVAITPSPIQEWVQSNAVMILIVSNVLNIGLRFITKGRISLYAGD